ncbi:MAG TPA: D-glycero-beta-D-manno-heptose-7-phosphate kinase [Verrucomicrobiae bacterium]|nr:D-glycero-beta-D-manno-heptose-7-phosphate kinase [Verrucomicrobiae bacterium]
MPTEAGWIARFAGARVLVIGDLMLDEFIWGKVSRISPEAPVPVVNVTGESYYPGGAANVARNLRDLGAKTALVGVLGEDASGERLCRLLAEAGIETGGVQHIAAAPTTVKTRIIARNQQVVRVDRERPPQMTAEQKQRTIALIDAGVDQADGIVVADYGKGLLDQPIADHICRVAADRGKVLAVDPHPHTSLIWKGATAIKPNRLEAFTAAGMRLEAPVDPPMSDRALLAAAERLLAAWEPGCLLVTLGEQGMMLFASRQEPYHIPTRAKEVFDVSGAGDTAIAVLTLGLIAGALPRQAAELANRASGIAVGKLGTATVTPAELEASFA